MTLEGSIDLIRLFLMLEVMCLFSVVLLCPLSVAQPNVIFEEIKIELVDLRPPGGKAVIRVYWVIDMLYNTGDTKSMNITIKFPAPHSKTDTRTLQPLEMLSSNKIKTSENSGFYLYSLPIGAGDTMPSTQDLEMLAGMNLLLVFRLIQQKKIKSLAKNDTLDPGGTTSCTKSLFH